MKKTLNRISSYLWEIPKSNREDMNVPAFIYSTEEMLEMVKHDKSLLQLINVTTLPGILKFAVVMPDVHEGYGFPIGAVAAIDYENGVISPGGIGYDINCGVRLLKTNFKYKDFKDRIEKVAQMFYDYIPSGVGKSGGIRLGPLDMEEILNGGVKWAVKKGYALETDMKYIESGGSLDTANDRMVSERAKGRGRDQLGTMGSGNHFVEIDRVQSILDDKIANAYGLSKDQIVILIHTGSRGLGHQVATDYIKDMIAATDEFGYKLPDRELACAPFESKLGQSYFGAMCAAANFAWTNRQLITFQIRKVWKELFGDSEEIKILYDVAHNIAKIEMHNIDGVQKKVIVHRKGATRAFPPYHPELPAEYLESGQPVLIPGSMGTASYVLSGLTGSMDQSFGSSCHGAGRIMSRTAATKQVQGGELKDRLNNQGIVVETASLRGLAEEAPEAYKDVESVVDIVEMAGIAKKIARLVPLAVIKG